MCVIVSKFDNCDDSFEKYFASELNEDELCKLTLPCLDTDNMSATTLIEFMLGCVDPEHDDKTFKFEVFKMSQRLLKLIKGNKDE